MDITLLHYTIDDMEIPCVGVSILVLMDITLLRSGKTVCMSFSYMFQSLF